MFYYGVYNGFAHEHLSIGGRHSLQYEARKAKSKMAQPAIAVLDPVVDRQTPAASPSLFDEAAGTRLVPPDASTGTPYIGTQGWSVPGWQGLLYPTGLRPNRRLAIYARVFNSVEVNSTFYAIPSPQTVRGWYDDTPPGFKFALKAPRSITHERRLRESGRELAEFLTVAEVLGDKLGPILIQLPPGFGPAALPALSEFLRLLPVDSMRFCVEVRHPSLRSPGVRSLLHRRGAGMVTTNLLAEPGDIETLNGLAYLRLLGARRVPGTGAQPDPSTMTMEQFASETAMWTAGLRRASQSGTRNNTGPTNAVYAFVSNDYYGPGVLPAAQLKKHLGMPTQLRSGAFSTFFGYAPADGYATPGALAPVQGQLL